MRLIDADALLAEVINNNSHKVGDYVITFDYGAAAAINNAPTIDAEPVVRCKDCKSAEESPHLSWQDMIFCNKWERVSDACGYCHRGAKMDGGRA